MIEGSCCCGAVAFELAAPPSMMGTCHCSRCRKLGTSTFAFVKRQDVVLVRGGDAIATYAAAPPYTYDRSFCRHCGTALGEIGSAAESFPLNANLFDSDPGVAVRFHEFVAEKPAWLVIGDDAPQFAGHPPRPA